MGPQISMRVSFALMNLVLAAWFLIPTAAVHAEESFFKGKTIRFIAGSTPGGGTDVLIRLQARYLSKHIPGKPRIIVVNMPGAGGLIAANYLYNRAGSDGLTISNLNNGLLYRVATHDRGAKFRLDKFTYLGQVAAEGQALYLRADTPYTSLEAIKKADRKPKLGAQAKAHSSNVVPKVIERVFEGVKFDVIAGYPGTAEILLDIERGALDGRSHSIGSFLSRRRDWVENGFVKVLVVSSQGRDYRLPDVPTLAELAPPGKKNLLEALYAIQGRRVAMAPGIPPERAKIMRDAYAAMHRDKAFVKEGKRMGWNIEPIRGEELNILYTKLINNKELMALYRQVLEGK